jgi:hypothetical protein
MQQEQGYELDTSLLYQNTMSTKLLETNGAEHFKAETAHTCEVFLSTTHCPTEQICGGTSITKPNKEECSECSGATPWVSWMFIT